MKSVLISIRPKWCEMISSGKKTIEVRKTAPKIETPFKCYIYCTKPSKKYQTICGCMVLNSDELFRHPRKGIKYGDSIELMAEDDYTKDNFLNGKVIGEFVCDKIDTYDYEYCTHPEIGMDYDCGDNWFCVDDADLKNSCMSYEELRAYAGNKDVYGWHISALKIYDKPKKLSEFTQCHKCEYNSGCKEHEYSCDGAYKVTRPPQSWMYVEELEGGTNNA